MAERATRIVRTVRNAFERRETRAAHEGQGFEFQVCRAGSWRCCLPTRRLLNEASLQYKLCSKRLAGSCSSSRTTLDRCKHRLVVHFMLYNSCHATSAHVCRPCLCAGKLNCVDTLLGAFAAGKAAKLVVVICRKLEQLSSPVVNRRGRREVRLPAMHTGDFALLVSLDCWLLRPACNLTAIGLPMPTTALRVERLVVRCGCAVRTTSAQVAALRTVCAPRVATCKLRVALVVALVASHTREAVAFCSTLFLFSRQSPAGELRAVRTHTQLN